MQDEKDHRGEEIAELRKELQDKEKARPPDELSDEDVVVAAARALKFATKEYAKESSTHVSRQRTGGVDLAFIDSVEEFERTIPQLLRMFVDSLSRSSHEQEVDGLVAARRAGPKYLLAGVLTYWAHNQAWFKNVNAMGIFCGENGIKREALDYLAKSLRISWTDMSLWRLTQTVVKQVHNKRRPEH